jgi:adenine specific DNA methylase Mod
VDVLSPAETLRERNQLLWGDKLKASLLQEFKGKVDLIYIAPPFDMGADFSMSAAIFNKIRKSLMEVFNHAI